MEEKTVYKWQVAEKRRKIIVTVITVTAMWLTLFALIMGGCTTNWNYPGIYILGLLGWSYTFASQIVNIPCVKNLFIRR